RRSRRPALHGRTWRDNHKLVLTIGNPEHVREEPQNVVTGVGNGGRNQEAKDGPGRSEDANGIAEIRVDGALMPPTRAPSSLSRHAP
uniref:Uncharacterized protein n=1 Tax=Oryza glaberrima TaxID=4538 RepID=I1QU57_ORYGL